MKTEATMIDTVNPIEVQTTETVSTEESIQSAVQAAETAAAEGTMHPSKWIFETDTPIDTFALGEDMGRLAYAGEIICLDGDLGVGKTVFTKGFAKGLGITEPVCSPTFTIIQEYHEGRLPMYHFDVYRLADPEELYEIGYEEFFFGEGVCLVEWASLVAELIPAEAVHVKLEKDVSRGVDYRRIEVIRPGEEARIGSK